MKASSRKSFCLPILVIAMLVTLATGLGAQTADTQKQPAISGTVCDAESNPLAGAEVLLEEIGGTQAFHATTDAQGRFHFEGVLPGTYTLRTKREGYEQGSEGPFVLRAQEGKSVTLHLVKVEPAGSEKDASGAIPFSDEPQFTVAGVTDTSALGVHGASRVLPNSIALAKDTAALAGEGANPTNASARAGEANAASEEASIRAKLATAESADLRFQLAEIEENEGHPLEAVNDYQRAAELQPTEAHLFAWGAELLLHRAFEPAIEVFSKGRERYPQSVRMWLGIGATKYAQGSREEAAQFFLQASDFDPSNPQPYLFLGRLLVTENSVPTSWTEKMKRFATLHPENATAHYLYAFALAKQGAEEGNAAEIELQLNTAIKLDAHFGNAYLQLGILRSERKDFSGAVAALQKAVENTALPDEAHYRLAEVYRRIGDAEKARQETALYKQISAQKAEDAERERHEMQQFVYTLRGQAAPVPVAPNPQ